MLHKAATDSRQYGRRADKTVHLLKGTEKTNKEETVSRRNSEVTSLGTETLKQSSAPLGWGLGYVPETHSL
jgi:hypothetical protein